MIGNRYLQPLKRYYIHRMSYASNLVYLSRSVAALVIFQFFFFLAAVIALGLGALLLLFALLSAQKVSIHSWETL